MFLIRHLGSVSLKRHGLCKWKYDNGNVSHREYRYGKLHGKWIQWDEDGNTITEKYYLYDEEVSKEEYRKYQLIEELSGLGADQ